MSPWRRKLIPIWLSQFLSMMGFSFALPFIPYFIQDMGVTDPDKLKLWIALFGSATPLAFVFVSPIWGHLADRYGRRVMLLRANFAASLVLALMSIVQSPLQLVILRVLQGCFTGTVSAAQALVAVQAPRHRSGAALGTLSAAVFSGTMVGGALGGVCAHWFGYRAALLVSGWLPLLAAILLVFGTREDMPADDDETESPPDFRAQLARLGPYAAILSLIGGISFCRQFDLSFLPLLVQDIHGSLEGASVWSGALASLGGVAGLLAGITIGNLADRVAAPTLARRFAIGGGLLMIPQGLAYSFLMLFPARFGMVYCAGALDPVLQVWIAKVTPENRRGSIFGWAATARSIGWLFAPLLSGVVASLLGVRWVYFVGGVLFFFLIPLIGFVAARMAPEADHRGAGLAARGR